MNPPQVHKTEPGRYRKYEQVVTSNEIEMKTPTNTSPGLDGFIGEF